MAKCAATMVVTIKPIRGFRALRRACRLSRELAESQPWNAEAKRLRKDLRIVLEELAITKEKP